MLEVKIVVQSLRKTGVHAFVLDTVFVKKLCVGGGTDMQKNYTVY
jgi:hypothetical protein